MEIENELTKMGFAYNEKEKSFDRMIEINEFHSIRIRAFLGLFVEFNASLVENDRELYLSYGTVYARIECADARELFRKVWDESKQALEEIVNKMNEIGDF